jgi:adenylate kinase
MGAQAVTSMTSVVILLGPPGAGKGTQAARLGAARGLPHVSTGDLFRSHLARKTPVGLQAKSYMSAGKLVPDSVVLDMLRERVGEPDCARGYVLDGFPRTLPQAKALEERLGAGVQLTVLNLAVSDETIVERLSGRLVCRANGNHVQHAKNSPPRAAGRCDACGGELYQRDDDAPAVVRERLRVYHQETEPLVRLYSERGVLHTVDGERAPDQVYADLLRRIPT